MLRRPQKPKISVIFMLHAKMLSKGSEIDKKLGNVYNLEFSKVHYINEHSIQV